MAVPSDDPPRELTCILPAEAAGQRLDQVLARLFPAYSRARLQQWIRQGEVSVDGKTPRPRDSVRGGERVLIKARIEAQLHFDAEAIPLNLIFEDDHLLVIDKPAGLVVHPAAGNWSGTLLNALLYHAPGLKNLPRAGIVHRLDKETSGLLVVAKTLAARKSLVEQLQTRMIERDYLALVQGRPVAGGTVNAPIGRHPVDRKRMAVTDKGKPAVTHYRIETRFRAHTLLRVSLETGRTHQIRVHLAHIRYPIVGDPVYGGRAKVPAGASAALITELRGVRRQILHAWRLGLIHPATGEALQWRAPAPADMEQTIKILKIDANA